MLIWFSGPIGRLAERLAPPSPTEWRDQGVPRYFDDSLLDMPALANDMIENFNEVARLSRAIAKASRSLSYVRLPRR